MGDIWLSPRRPGFDSRYGNLFELVQPFKAGKEVEHANHWASQHDAVAEWLRRWTANPMGSARVGSNPIHVDKLFSLIFCVRRGQACKMDRPRVGSNHQPFG